MTVSCTLDYSSLRLLLNFFWLIQRDAGIPNGFKSNVLVYTVMWFTLLVMCFWFTSQFSVCFVV